VLLTRSPVSPSASTRFVPRLACVRPAASVRPEPGSNSPLKEWRPPEGERCVSSTETGAFGSNAPIPHQQTEGFGAQLAGRLHADALRRPTGSCHGPSEDGPCHWLLAPCAVLKERSVCSRVPIRRADGFREHFQSGVSGTEVQPTTNLPGHGRDPRVGWSSGDQNRVQSGKCTGPRGARQTGARSLRSRSPSRASPQHSGRRAGL
jgi:hypothetical protein